MPRALLAGPLLVALSLCIVPAPARAQWRAELELSGARLRLDERASTGALTFGSTVEYASPRIAFDLVGLGTFGDWNERTAQALGSASWLGLATRRTRWSLGASGSAFAEPGSEASVSGHLNARQQLLFGAGGSWTGVALGGVSDRGDRFAVRSIDAGIWQGRGAAQALIATSLVDTRAYVGYPVGNQIHYVSEPVTYTDVGPSLRWEPRGDDGRRLLALSVSGGARFIQRGAGGGPTTKGFGGVDLELPIVRNLGFSAAFGRQLSDLARGTPASRYASIGLRLDVRSFAAAGEAPASVARPVEDRGPRVDLLAAADGATLAVGARGATRVELTASFTAWEPVLLHARDGRWVFPQTLPSGTHRLLVRIDGGAWIAPANLAATDDGDGGRVALLVVP